MGLRDGGVQACLALGMFATVVYIWQWASNAAGNWGCAAALVALLWSIFAVLAGLFLAFMGAMDMFV